jgi:hypothetical protein
MRLTHARWTRSTCLAIGAAALASPGALVNASEDESPAAPPAVVRALDALARQPAVSYSALRRLEGELLNDGERGWLEVASTFEPGRGLSHTVLAQGGSARIRERALEQVLEKEIESTRADEARQAAYSSDNYRYRLLDPLPGEVRIELMPKRSDVRLLKGTALVAVEPGGLRRVEGQLARNPSFWVRDVRIARTYAQVGGATLPVELVSTARIRLFGEARLTIRSTYSTVGGQPVH